MKSNFYNKKYKLWPIFRKQYILRYECIVFLCANKFRKLLKGLYAKNNEENPYTVK